MATYVRCDGCGVEADQSDANWWSLTATKKDKAVSQVTIHDLCLECWQRGEAAVRKPRSRIMDLSPKEVATLQQIWRNATSFDQSIGDFNPRPEPI